MVTLFEDRIHLYGPLLCSFTHRTKSSFLTRRQRPNRMTASGKAASISLAISKDFVLLTIRRSLMYLVSTYCCSVLISPVTCFMRFLLSFVFASTATREAESHTGAGGTNLCMMIVTQIGF